MEGLVGPERCSGALSNASFDVGEPTTGAQTKQERARRGGAIVDVLRRMVSVSQPEHCPCLCETTVGAERAFNANHRDRVLPARKRAEDAKLVSRPARAGFGLPDIVGDTARLATPEAGLVPDTSFRRPMRKRGGLNAVRCLVRLDALACPRTALI